MSPRATLTLFVVLLVAAAGGLYLGLVGDGSFLGAGDAPRGAAVRAAEDWRHEDSLAIPASTAGFPTLQGDTASLAEYGGRVVVLNLWGTWCPPCRREVPHLVDLQSEIEPRGGTVVGLAVESGSPEDVSDFVERYSMNYPIWLSSTREVVRHFDATGFPTTLIVDRGGVIRERFLGPQSKERLLAAVEPLLRPRR